MAVTANELYRFLNEKIPPSLTIPGDNDGLACCPDQNAPVRRVLVALDITEEVVETAVREGYDVILSHHPILFHGVKAVNASSGVARKLIRMIENGISAMCFHTRLDAVAGGVNDILAERIGIRDTAPFGNPGEEIGRIGHLDVPMPLDDFCRLLKEKLDDPLVLAGDGKVPVYRVAVVGGSGKDVVPAALLSGADTYVSGRLDYHHLVDAPENGINLIEVGHYYSEFPVCERLAALAREAAPEAEVRVMSSCRIQQY